VRRIVPVPAMLALAATLVAPGPLAAQVPPDADWQTLETEHFRVTYPARLESLARRAAGVAEEARADLTGAFREPPQGRVEFLLTDHVDFANGFADVTPYSRIVVFARPPVDNFTLAHFDDWLELVITHELAHVVHLDVTGTLGRLLRAIFGRVPTAWPFFPQGTAPEWVVEGLATWYESALTGAGRVRGAAFPMLLRTAALDGGLETLDRASGASQQWPAGRRSYLYGSFFLDWLLQRHGEEKLDAFVEALAGQWVPYRLNAAAEDAFGESFAAAWEEWVQQVENEARAWADTVASRSPGLPPLRPVTREGREALHPRFSPAGDRLFWVSDDGRTDSEIRALPAARLGAPAAEPVTGGGAGAARVTRVNGRATLAPLPDGGLLFAQWTRPDPWRILADLFLRDAQGALRRVTREARVEHPSVAPDGSWAVAIRNGGGRTDLVRVELPGGEVTPLVPSNDTLLWALPRVSPDGRWIAASRWRPGAHYDVVVLDAGSGALVREVTDDRAVDLAPAWGPDGWLLWGSDRSGVPNIYGVQLDGSGRAGPLRQFTDVTTGVAFPAIDPRGRWLVVSHHRRDGWDLASMPFDPARTRDPLPPAPAYRGPAPGAPGPRRAAPVEGESRGYTPWRTLTPRHWVPLFLPEAGGGGTGVIGPFLGMATEVQDLVGRHALDAALAVSVSDGSVDARVSWSWRGLGNPLLSLTGTQEWDAGGPFALERGGPVFLRERERRLSAALRILRPDWRAPASLTLSAGVTREERALVEPDGRASERARLARPSATLADLRASLSLSTARAHDLSLSAEEGFSAFARARWRPHVGLDPEARSVAGDDRSVREVLAQGRGYLSFRGWGWADHVLAGRISAGAAAGPGADGFWFDVGGAQGQGDPLTGLTLFGSSNLFFPVRGYVDGARSGRNAWSASVEWRFPLWWPNRGWGLFPVHLDRVHGALFFDAGNAWGPDWGVPGFRQPRAGPLTSAGFELSTRGLLLFQWDLRLRVGVVQALRDAPGSGAGTSVYIRFGPSF
jgi:hypothetical protein